MFILHARRSSPTRKLKNIEERLRSSCEKLASSELVVQGDKEVLQHLEDLREAIFDYQVRSRP